MTAEKQAACGNYRRATYSIDTCTFCAMPKAAHEKAAARSDADELPVQRATLPDLDALASLTPGWSLRDRRLLLALVRLGSPTDLQSGAAFPAPRVERGAGDGGVPFERRDGGEAERVRAELLHAYHSLGRLLGLPAAERLPPPGKV